VIQIKRKSVGAGNPWGHCHHPFLSPFFLQADRSHPEPTTQRNKKRRGAVLLSFLWLHRKIFPDHNDQQQREKEVLEKITLSIKIVHPFKIRPILRKTQQRDF
jgi:hypothetical protein